MENEKLLELLKNEEFAKKIVAMETPEEVQKAFEDQGVEITIDEVKFLGEIINKSIEKGGKPLTEEDLEEISGGYNKEKIIEFGKGMREVLPITKVNTFNVGKTVGGLGLVIAGAIGVGATYMGVKWGIKKIKNRNKK